MDSNLVIVAGLVIVPTAVLMFFRINATMVFLGLCLGYVLTQFLGSDAKSFADTFLSSATVSTSVMKLVLLIFPAFFTAFFMIHTVRGSRLVLNALPSLSVGCLLALLVVPLLPTATSHAIIGTSLWQQASRLQDIIIGLGALVSLLFLYLLRPKKYGKKSTD
ncbi:MAG: hypothetical protein ACREF5_01200 [Candidatus Saccharimonadales bacterium]